ncbi:MAG TPA: hypothetical protein VND64_26255 [Pirellulales bacterium]|nr:hypothetical protein [Pirellulales bacterium]
MTQATTRQPPDDFHDDQPGAPAWMPQKQPAWAFALNFFLPGAGLVYLRKPLWGLVNFVTVIGLAAVIYWVLPPDVFERCAPWIGIVFQVGSGLLAQGMTGAEQGIAEEDGPTADGT